MRCLGPFLHRLEKSALDKGKSFVTVLILGLTTNISIILILFLAAATVPAIVCVVSSLVYCLLLFAVTRCRTEKDISTVATGYFVSILGLLTFMCM